MHSCLKAPNTFPAHNNNTTNDLECTLYSGVKVGSIGPTMGQMMLDNGYLMLHSVRIPRENMLMRDNKVSSSFINVSHALSHLYFIFHLRILLNAILGKIFATFDSVSTTVIHRCMRMAGLSRLYGSMVRIRVHIVDVSFQMAAQAVTIATRYSAARRQGTIKPG